MRSILGSPARQTAGSWWRFPIRASSSGSSCTPRSRQPTSIVAMSNASPTNWVSPTARGSPLPRRIRSLMPSKPRRSAPSPRSAPRRQQFPGPLESEYGCLATGGPAPRRQVSQIGPVPHPDVTPCGVWPAPGLGEAERANGNAASWALYRPGEIPRKSPGTDSLSLRSV